MYLNILNYLMLLLIFFLPSNLPSMEKNQMKNDEIIRQILDEKSLISLNNLKHINKEKGNKLQDILIQHFQMVRRLISYEEYCKIVQEIEKNTKTSEIKIKRRSNMYDLEEIE
ncbi:cell apoptosis-related protein [Nosema bombycis CQ1]|uniref:Cell apoptosis-related protein n=1 Tax=Nosema bombycis (strain CQ1 / CVCC 102059) TaxID=578461 RepID=R0MHS4_NOSB1|nr:cell apoptosis-related protein [Nosema bombycis CQ1]|eukprot:EOB13700.1 cell apoptosis-related protein [Nosema bombycis CQ1]